MNTLKTLGTGICVTIASIILASGASAATFTRSTKVPVFGTIAYDATRTSGNAGTGTFDWIAGALPSGSSTGEVYVDASNVFNGSFWLSNVGWATFSNLGADGARLVDTGNGVNFNVTGFAWSENAGWIAFAHNTSGVGNVTYDKNQGVFHGFAWSQNLGWIPFEGLTLDITPPSADNFKPFMANNAKSFTVVDTGSTGGYAYDVKVDQWGTATYNTYATKTFTHDFRLAKDYTVTITDPSGNQATGEVTVVSNVPATALMNDGTNDITIGAFSTDGTPQATTYSKLQPGSTVKTADGQDTFSLSMKLRDKYGNVVRSVAGVRDLAVKIAFANNVDANQLENLDIGDAIVFSNNNFAGLTHVTPGVCDGTSGSCQASIASIAPTKAGYPATTANNDIRVASLTWQITAQNGYTGVGGSPTVTDIRSDAVSDVGSNLRFKPIYRINDVKMNGSSAWTAYQGVPSKFDLEGTVDNPNAVTTISNPKVTSLLNLNGNNLNGNILISYQDPANLSVGTVCTGYSESTTSYKKTGDAASCDRPSSSVNVFSIPSGSSFTPTFTWTPKVILAIPASLDTSYASEISYTLGVRTAAYPSFTKNASSGVITPTTVATGVKILGFAGGNGSSFATGLDSLGSSDKSTIRNQIRKNVALLTKNRSTYADVNYDYKTSTQTITSASFATKDTIIVNGANVIIDGDINLAKLPGLIILKDASGNGGNVYVTDTVKNLRLAIYAEGGLVSGNGTDYYSDSQSAKDQLYLKGSVISANTVGGASASPAACPEGMACSDTIAKRYDLNLFRAYAIDPDGVGPLTGAGTAASGVPTAGADYPFVIEYDPTIVTNPPVGFGATD